MANEAIINDSIVRRGYSALRQRISDASYILFFIYCCLGLLLLPFYQFQIDPDSISYINIAHLYAIGDSHDALNGFWAPLISWLVVPLLLTKFQPVFSYKIVSFILSCFAFLALKKLSYCFALNKQVRLLVLLAAIPMLLSYAFSGGAPDILFLFISLCYLYFILKANQNSKVVYGCIIGFLGACLYFSKSYGFYFFIIHFSLFTCIFCMKEKAYQGRRKVLLQYTFGIAIFLLLSGTWMYAISNKYQHFTTSTSGEYNIRFDSLGSQGQPMLYQGLLPLPYVGAVSAWDDPSFLTIDYETSPRLLEWVAYQIVHVGENVFRTLYYFELFSIFSILVVLIYAIRYFNKRGCKTKEGIQDSKRRFWKSQIGHSQGQVDGKLHMNIFYSLITVLLYTTGYELLHIEARFLWFDAILFLLLCACYAYNNRSNFVRNMKLRRFLFLIIFFSFWLYPILSLVLHVNEDQAIYTTSRQLQLTYHLKGNIASNNDGDSTNSWGLTLFYAYFLNSKYYGAVQKKITNEELQRQLRKYHINYYFVWNSTCQLSECRKIAEFELRFLWTYQTKHLIVYQIKNNGS